MTEPELTRLVECVPNVSEGCRPEVVDEIVAAFGGADPGVLVLDRSSDPDHNRTVITLMGQGPALVEAAVAGASACARLIDLTTHRGVHPRMGARTCCRRAFGDMNRSGRHDPTWPERRWRAGRPADSEEAGSRLPDGAADASRLGRPPQSAARGSRH